MAATVAILRNRNRPARAISPVTISRWAVAALTGSLALATVFLLERRVAGALTEPLPSLALIGAGLAALSFAFLVRTLGQIIAISATDRLLSICKWPMCLSLLAVAIVISLPRSSPIGLIPLWLTVVGTEIVLLRWRFHQDHGHINRVRDRQQARKEIAVQNFGSNRTESLPLLDELADATQQVVYRIVDGKLIVEGWLQIGFTTGQRTATAHIAFCPAFERVPVVDAEQASGCECAIKAALVLPWGVRWEIKLGSPATEPSIAKIEFIARET